MAQEDWQVFIEFFHSGAYKIFFEGEAVVNAFIVFCWVMKEREVLV